MGYEETDLYQLESQEQVNEAALKPQDLEANDNPIDTPPEVPHASFNPAILAYGAYKAQEIPAVKDFINECKESFNDKVSKATDTVDEYLKHLEENLKDFSKGIYDTISSFFEGTKGEEAREFSMYSKEFSETREFGIEKCVEAAKENFNPGVISEWMNLSDEQRAEICYAYADEVAKAFKLEQYNGVIFEQLEPGTLGYNSGDGYIHLTTDLLNPLNSPFNLIDTITHELRHQYQSECVNGAHDVPDEVRNEWAVATEIYTTDNAWCYDPWGYMYNPLEIDSRYAGETVVREISNQMFNDALASA